MLQINIWSVMVRQRNLGLNKVFLRRLSHQVSQPCHRLHLASSPSGWMSHLLANWPVGGARRASRIPTHRYHHGHVSQPVSRTKALAFVCVMFYLWISMVTWVSWLGCGWVSVAQLFIGHLNIWPIPFSESLSSQCQGQKLCHFSGLGFLTFKMKMLD